LIVKVSPESEKKKSFLCAESEEAQKVMLSSGAVNFRDKRLSDEE